MPARPLALGLRGPNRVAIGRVRRMVAALRRLGGNLWMVDHAYTGAFVDNVGTTPVTAYGDLLGRVLDKTSSAHATQSAVASKPSVQRVPKRTRGPVNQLLYSQWGGGGTAPTGWTAFGAGGVEGALLPSGMRQRVFTSTASRDFIYAAPNVAANTVYTIAVYVHANPNSVNAQNIIGQGALPVGAGLVVPDIVPVADSFILATLTVGATAGSITLRVGLGASSNITGTLTLSSPALFSGTLTAQQILDNGGIPLTTTTALPNVLEWATVISFDGNNDFLTTGITTGEQGFVAAGVTFGGTSATNETIFCSGAGGAVQRGVWLVRDGVSSGVATSFRMGIGNGTALTMLSVIGTSLIGVPRVVEGGWDASTVFAGVDGAVASAARTGTATPAQQSALIGAYSSGLHTLNGPMHAIAYAPILPDAATRKIIRDGIAALQGRTL